MKQIPMLDLRLEYEYMKHDIDAAIGKCLEHQRWILGPEVKELEEKIAQYLGVKHCIGVSSGTDALVLSLRALAIKLKGEEYFDRTDEIITTPFTFTATGDAILRAGATPVFVDIDPATYNIDPVKIKEYLTSCPSLAGIIPVHLYGLACDMDELVEIAEDFNLFVLEDVAQAFGGTWKGRRLGSIGIAGTLSFFPSKNLGGFDDGGMVATNHREIAELVRMLLRHGGKDKYNVDHIGYNARLDTLQAGILFAKFKYINEFNERRKKIAKTYNEALKDLEGLILPIDNNSTPCTSLHHGFHQYTIRVSNGKREELQKHLKEKGISTMVYYPVPLHRIQVFDGRSKIFNGLNHAERAVMEVLSLPIEPLMEEEDLMSVVEAIREFFEKHST